MTQEEKDLLLKDLCARLPYGVIVKYKGHNTIKKNKFLTGSDLDCNMEYYKPYLRSMSSMTEEEAEEYDEVCIEPCLGIREYMVSNFMDWLNAHHLDYRGLIEKGLAIEAPENMYK